MSDVKNTNRRAYAPIGLALCCAVTLSAPAGSTPPQEPSALIERLSRVAALYRDSVLHFTCREKLIYDGPATRGGARFRYLYRHDEHGRLQDDRTPISGEASLLKRPYVLLRAYSWLMMFDPTLRWRYRFEPAGEDTALERPALKLRFRPALGEGDNEPDWSGTLWVDRESLHPLRVVALKPRDALIRQRFREDVARVPGAGERGYRQVYTFARTVVDFGVERNAMRFPSRVDTRVSDYVVRKRRGKSAYRERPVYHVVQRYDDYRFFSVHTAEQVRAVALAP